MVDGEGYHVTGHMEQAISKANGDICSLSLWRVARGSKLMCLELIHGFFIT
jgi:hypothetical protein